MPDPTMRVAIIYHIFPHYRRPVLRELVKHGEHEFSFFSSLETVHGIRAFQGDDLITISPIYFKLRGSTWVLRKYIPIVLSARFDAVIVHGHPNMPASWIIGILGRLTGKKVLYWAHGWLRKERPLRATVRNLHYSLAHHVMTYGERAIELARASGFDASKITPIFNSLDWELAQAKFVKLEAAGTGKTKLNLGFRTDDFVVSCVARLTQLCRFDILIEAGNILGREGVPIRIALIGDGPERRNLEVLAETRGVEVDFVGETYDEELISQYVYASDVTASPGKVGLSAMHSLMYGTPVVSHDNLDDQMPEVEAIVSGITGTLFTQDSAQALADTLRYWYQRRGDRERTRVACLDVIKVRYNPVVQARTINQVISSLA